MRGRAKENLPHVLLTLLSIIQALALELLWSHVQEAAPLSLTGWAAIAYWMQVFSTFLSIVLIWIVYGTNVMRLRWVPGLSDSIYPFLVGILQFSLVEFLAPSSAGPWLLLMACIIAVMNWVAHTIFSRARLEPENAAFFTNFKPGTWRGFDGAFIAVPTLGLLGCALWLWPREILLNLIAQAVSMIFLARQLWQLNQYWHRSMQI